jgi:hypothetical protein
VTHVLRRTATGVGLAAALALTTAPAAHAIPFGANLGLPANVPFDCTVLPVPNALGNGYVALPSPAPTCTWMATGTINQPGAGTFLVPSGGVVTQVRVRVGPVTGPMQVIVLRAFRDVNEVSFPVCCTEVGRTPPFTPTPNAITTIATALAVRRDVVPDPVNNTLTFDSLALSVLAPNVPIPAFDTGAHDPANFDAPQALVYHPAVGPGQEAFARSSGVGGFQVLMDADVAPSTTGAGPAPAGGGTAPAAIRLVQAAASVRQGVAPVLVRCDLATGRCGGVLLLQSRQAAAAARGRGGRPRLVTYGSRRFDIAAGRQAFVRVSLTRAAKRLLRRRGSIVVWANATVGGRALAGAQLTLKRPRAAPRRGARPRPGRRR